MAVAYRTSPATARSEMAIFNTKTGERLGLQEGYFDNVDWRSDTDLLAFSWIRGAVSWTPSGHFEWKGKDRDCDETVSALGDVGRRCGNPNRVEVVSIRDNGLFTLSVSFPTSSPGWSPDGSRLAYAENGTIVVVETSGKVSRSAKRFDLPANVTPTWLSLKHVLVGNRDQGLLRLNVETNEVEMFAIPGPIPTLVPIEKLREASIGSDGRWLLISATSDSPAFLDTILIDMECQAVQGSR